jgi:hypothetical protein
MTAFLPQRHFTTKIAVCQCQKMEIKALFTIKGGIWIAVYRRAEKPVEKGKIFKSGMVFWGRKRVERTRLPFGFLGQRVYRMAFWQKIA